MRWVKRSSAARRVVPEQAPLEEASEVDVARRRGAEEALEIDGRGRGIRRDGVIPRARRAVAVDLALDERDLAEAAAPDELRGLLRAAHAHVLAADLDRLAALLGAAMNASPCSTSASWAFRYRRVSRRRARPASSEMPVVGGGDGDRVDVGAREDLGVVAGDGWCR